MATLSDGTTTVDGIGVVDSTLLNSQFGSTAHYPLAGGLPNITRRSTAGRSGGIDYLCRTVQQADAVYELHRAEAGPLHLDTYDVARNLAQNPRATDTNRWGGEAGTDGVFTETPVSGASDGPMLPDGSQSAEYMRYEITTAPTSGGSYFEWIGHSGFDANIDPGTDVGMVLYIRSSETMTGQHRGYGHDELGVLVWSSATSPAVELPAGQWVALADLWDTDAASAVMDYFRNRAENLTPLVLGQTIDLTCSLVQPEATAAGPYFDGDSAPAGYTSRWDGAVNASTSSLSTRPGVDLWYVQIGSGVALPRWVADDIWIVSVTGVVEVSAP